MNDVSSQTSTLAESLEELLGSFMHIIFFTMHVLFPLFNTYLN